MGCWKGYARKATVMSLSSQGSNTIILHEFDIERQSREELPHSELKTSRDLRLPNPSGL